MSKHSTTLAQQIADLEDPTPRDFDPEGFGDAFERADNGSGDDASSVDENEGRRHYQTVSESKLRQAPELLLSKEYEGASISREKLFSGEENGADDGSESGDDPFAKADSIEEDESDTMEGDGEYVDPDTVDLNVQDDGDQEIDSDEAFEEGDAEAFKHFKFRASKTHKQTLSDDEMEGFQVPTANADAASESASDAPLFNQDATEDEIEDEVNGYSDEDASEEGATDEEVSVISDDDEDESDADASTPKDSTRAGLAALMADQQTAVASMSLALKEDVAKGSAVKTQRATFDSLLNTRIRLQKALIASNTLSHEETTAASMPSDQAVIEAAESAALQLFNSLNALRACLPSTTSAKKRPFSATSSTSTADIYDHIASMDKHAALRTRPNLTKWALKTQEASLSTKQSKLSHSSVTPLTSVLDTQLSGSNLNRLISRTRTPRNCAPLQSAAGVEEDAGIYDDADWYSLLLRDLVDSKMSSNGADRAALATSTLNGPTAQSVSALRRESKQHRKGVDVKASKGRKMRYTVHEKLQNFMAPENRGVWEQRQADELFAGLMGRKVRGGLEEAEAEETDEEEAEVRGLRLFGGTQ